MMNNKISIRRSLWIAEILALFFLLCFCTGKEDPPDYYVNTPIAGFDWTGNEGPAPVTVQFINTSENSDQFEWDFGDGQISFEHSPQHTYNNFSAEPKNYLVVLKATDSGSGLFQRRSRVIVIQLGSGNK
jgi:PKD repeat protein